jgi:hypothetical protein
MQPSAKIGIPGFEKWFEPPEMNPGVNDFFYEEVRYSSGSISIQNHVNLHSSFDRIHQPILYSDAGFIFFIDIKLKVDAALGLINQLLHFLKERSAPSYEFQMILFGITTPFKISTLCHSL